MSNMMKTAKQFDMRGVTISEKAKFLSTSMTITRIEEGIPAGWNGDRETLPQSIRDRLDAHARKETGISDEPSTQESIENARRLNITNDPT